MARRLYETQEDRNSEQSIAEELSRKWMVKLEKLPIEQRLDYAMIRKGRVEGLCEIKQRKFAWGEFPTVMISASKVKYASEIYKAFDTKTMFVVSDRNGEIRFTPIHDLQYSLEYGGRTLTPRDNQDSELIIQISVYDFTKLEKHK